MASAPSASPSFTPPRKHQSTLHGDPFWQSTPRTNTSIAALMSAVQQIVPPATPPTPAAAPTQRYRRPQCTHVSMNRVYGHRICTMCGRAPEIGFLYACRQDDVPGQYDALPDVDPVPVIVPDDCDYWDAKARVAQHLQMNATIVESIRAGRYDVDQVDKLIAQREKLIRAIKEKEATPYPTPYSTSQPSYAPSQNIIASVGSMPSQNSSATSLPMTPAGTPGNTPSASAITTPIKQEAQTGRPRSTCNFQFCHTCRPFFVDRMYASFETVLSGKFADLSTNEMACLPVMSRDIALHIGLPKNPASAVHITRSQQSMDLSSQDADDADDEISVDWTQTTSNNESEFGSDTLDSSALYPCPGPGQCPLWSRYSGCAYDIGFDDGRRATNHGFLAEYEANRLTPDTSISELHQMLQLTDTPGTSSTASSVSLPTPTASPLTPLRPTDDTFDVALQKQLGRIGKANSIGAEYSPRKSRNTLYHQDSKSSLGSEVEVEGGVALTEEAVENHVPDIVTTD